MLYRLKEGFDGVRIVEGMSTLTLSKDMSQTQLWSISIRFPDQYVEQYDEEFERAQKNAEDYIKSNKSKDVKNNKESK
jgi:hypothetical protein